MFIKSSNKPEVHALLQQSLLPAAAEQQSVEPARCRLLGRFQGAIHT